MNNEQCQIKKMCVGVVFRGSSVPEMLHMRIQFQLLTLVFKQVNLCPGGIMMTQANTARS